MASYTNTHTNHTDDASKKWPVNIPWSSNWDAAKYPITEKISGALIRELRQHAKALEANFNFTASDPTYSRTTDEETAVGDLIESEDLNQTPGVLTAGGSSLLDGIKTIKVSTTLAPISDGSLISKETLKNIAVELQSISSYANYTNYNNSGYGQYTNHSQYTNTNIYQDKSYANGGTYSQANYGRYNEYNRAIHFDNDADPSKYVYSRANWYTRYIQYLQADTYVNVSTPGYSQALYANSTVAYSNAAYSNSFNNPATYQNTL